MVSALCLCMAARKDCQTSVTVLGLVCEVTLLPTMDFIKPINHSFIQYQIGGDKQLLRDARRKRDIKR